MFLLGSELWLETSSFVKFTVYGGAGPADPSEDKEGSRCGNLVDEVGVSCPFASKLFGASACICDGYRPA